MKRMTIWLLLVFTSATIGFGIAAQSDRPRIVLNNHLVAALLMQGPTTDPLAGVCGNSDKWKELKCRFDEYKKKSDTIFTEKWKIHSSDNTGIPVRVHYNILTSEATIICKKDNCLQSR